MSLTTNVKTTSLSAYTIANVGPCLIELKQQGAIRVHVGTALPSAGTDSFHILTYPGGLFSYSGTETVYIRADSVKIPDVVVTPIL